MGGNKYDDDAKPTEAETPKEAEQPKPTEETAELPKADDEAA